MFTYLFIRQFLLLMERFFQVKFLSLFVFGLLNKEHGTSAGNQTRQLEESEESQLILDRALGEILIWFKQRWNFSSDAALSPDTIKP